MLALDLHPANVVVLRLGSQRLEVGYRPLCGKPFLTITDPDSPWFAMVPLAMGAAVMLMLSGQAVHLRPAKLRRNVARIGFEAPRAVDISRKEKPAPLPLQPPASRKMPHAAAVP